MTLNGPAAWSLPTGGGGGGGTGGGPLEGTTRDAKLERLSSLDSGFLALETPATPMHIGSLVYLDPAAWRDAKGHIRLEAFRALVSERLGLAPRFRPRPVVAPLNLGRPVWLDDPHFD